MNNIVDERNIVFFLGAGFSADSKYPLIRNFGTCCNEEYEKLKPHAIPGRNFRNTGPLFIESFRIFQSFQNFCKRSLIIKAEEVNNMESVFGIAEVLRESGVAYVELNNTKYHIDELISHIQLTLWKLYQKGPILAQNQSSEMKRIKEEIYKPFFEILIDHLPKLTFITTNYDLIIESMVFQSGRRCMYPIHNERREKSIIAGQRFEDVHDYRYVCYPLKTSDSTGKIRYRSFDEPILCKLHGSVNFFYKSPGHNNSEILIADDLGNNEKIGKSGVWNNLPSILALDAIWNLKNKYGKSLTPAIIPPTYSKLTGQVWVKDIWNTAFYALSKAEKVFFIGYSFPETDGFMKSMLQGAMAMRTNRQLPELHVIDPGQETIDRYKNLFGSNFIKAYRFELKDAIKSNVFKECLGS